MIILPDQVQAVNKPDLRRHVDDFDYLSNALANQGVEVDALCRKLADFQVAIPSWALGAGGTRFGRFHFGGEPSTLEEKIDDVGVLQSLTQSAGSISLHIPWDIPRDYQAIKERATARKLSFDAVNSNTFQDQKDAKVSYKFGSFSHVNPEVREQATQHALEVIKIGQHLGSNGITIWLADGSSFPGQSNFQTAFNHVQDCLKKVHLELPEKWKMFIEYKPYEPNFYSTVVQDWGTSLMLANECGEKAFTLVDLGHHLPNTNIEQIVSILMLKGKLGGFHFNDSKYGDDDLTVGAMKPYALFLIFKELVYGMDQNPQNPPLSWMIDASHNIKDPLEDLMQSLEAILEAYAKALLVDQKALHAAQEDNDTVKCQEIIQNAYRTDVRPLIAEARLKNSGALYPIKAFRELNIRSSLIKDRGEHSRATGL